MRRLVAWLKSTLLLKIGCQDTHIYMKTECLQTKWDTAFLGGKGKDKVALIKSLIYVSVGIGARRGALYKIYQSRSNLYQTVTNFCTCKVELPI